MKRRALYELCKALRELVGRVIRTVGLVVAKHQVLRVWFQTHTYGPALVLCFTFQMPCHLCFATPAGLTTRLGASDGNSGLVFSNDVGSKT